MVRQLVGTPSVSSTQQEFDQSNIDVIHLLANWLEPLGFRVEIIPIKGKAGKSNLIARFGEGSNGLVLSGHSDTVPFDEHLWQSDPFAITEQDEHICNHVVATRTEKVRLAQSQSRAYVCSAPYAVRSESARHLRH